MEKHYANVRNKNLIMTFILSLLMVIFLFSYNWIIATLFLLILILLFYFTRNEDKRVIAKEIKYIKDLTYHVDTVGRNVSTALPVGVIIYDDDYTIRWANRYVYNLTEDELLNRPLSLISDQFIPKIKSEADNFYIKLNYLQFAVDVDYERNVLYLFDRTREKELEKLYEEEKIVLGTIYLDNYEEITRNMEDNIKSSLNSLITTTLNRWADDYQLYLKRTSQERFFAVMTQKTLQLLEESKFEILEEIREIHIEKEQRNPVTLSIGIGTGNVLIPELAKLSQSGLDLALGRGGDQIAIRDNNGDVRFYGGKTNPMEKRTRVRARVISHALSELVKESDNVIIMGHKSPDMDSLGACIGVLNIAQSNGVEGYIVFDANDNLSGVDRLVSHLREDEIWRHFIGLEEAEAIFTSRSLIVVVDTHRPSLVVMEKLLYKASHIVVIDHHRRGEDFIENPTLVYIEPYASSAAELVTELIEYQPKKKRLSKLAATALLSGIVVDTKSFGLRTGSRTFDAASYLRSKGADLTLIQKFQKEDLQTVIKRNQLIEKAIIFHDNIAIVASEKGIFDQVLIAQTADTLLTMDGIIASFVIAFRAEGVISISARSLEEINVQVIMEEMGGGGHLTNAATQITDMSIEEVKEKLQEILTDYLEGSN